MAPLLESLADIFHGRLVIRSDGSEIYSTPRQMSERLVTAQPGIIELKVDGREASMHVEYSRATVDPAFEKSVLAGQLASGAAHDINNILTLVYSDLEYLKNIADNTSDPADRERLNNIVNDLDLASSNIKHLCRRMLALTSSKNELQAVSVTETIRDSLQLVNPLIKQAGDGRCRVSVVDNLDKEYVCVAVSSDLLACFTNILKNAIEHGFKDRKYGTITIEAQSIGGIIKVEVSNDGALIPAGVADDLFRRPIMSTNGNGIGLITAARLVKSFGGDIAAVSENGQTTFAIFLQEA